MQHGYENIIVVLRNKQADICAAKMAQPPTPPGATFTSEMSRYALASLLDGEEDAADLVRSLLMPPLPPTLPRIRSGNEPTGGRISSPSL